MTTTRQPSFKEYPFKHEGLTALVLRQLQVRDDVEVGLYIDRALRAEPRSATFTPISFLKLQKRESVRFSIFAVQREGSDDLERVNDGEPFTEMDGWLDTSYALLTEMHRDINEVTEEEDFRKGAVIRSPAEVLAKINRARAGTTSPGAPGNAEPAGT